MVGVGRGSKWRSMPLLSTMSVVLFAATAAWFALTAWGPRGSPLFAVLATVTGLLVAGCLVMVVVALFRSVAELGRQERRLQSLVRYTADAVAICDLDGRVRYISPAIERLTGRPAQSWLRADAFDAVHPDDVATATTQFRYTQQTPGCVTTFPARIMHTGGDTRWARMTLSNLREDPAVNGIVLNLSDITEARRYHQQLCHQASHDALTDLANRSLFAEQLQRALDRDGGRLSLALLDLDSFTSVNDEFGQETGHGLLVAVAERLRRGVRPYDLVARLGGDEFAILLKDVGHDQVDRVADRLLSLLAEPLTVNGHELCVPASMGIADADPGDDADQLMHRADVALYAAKAAGRNQYVRWAERLRPRTSHGAQLAAELYRALTDGEFELYYQPIVTLPSGELRGMEALLRWHHPQRGMVPPLDFIPAAEENGLIVAIGRWVINAACRQAAAWLAAYPATAPSTISVNVSPRQLREPGIAAEVAAALRASGLPAHRLMIEVTETAVVDQATAAANLTALRQLGVGISLDDFGTGHSTLSLLDAAPVDQLKLDRSFLHDTENDTIAVIVMKIAEAIGAQVVAEGIEMPEQAEHLHALGYRYAQGFHFGRPGTASSVEAQFKQGSLHPHR